MYIGQKAPLAPLSDHTPSKPTRNHEIRQRYAQCESVVTLAAAYDISQQRVSQIVRSKRK
jgi:Mor family transcriptional regulator